MTFNRFVLRYFLLLSLLLSYICFCTAQSDSLIVAPKPESFQKTEYDLSGFYIGIGLQHTAIDGGFLGTSSIPYIDENGLTQTTYSAGFTRYECELGVTHFKGILQTYFSFPFIIDHVVANPGKVLTKFDSGLSLGMRVFPWNFGNQVGGPFIGFSLSDFTHEQTDLSGRISSNHSIKPILEGGVHFKGKRLGMLFSVSGFLNSDSRIAVSKTKNAVAKLVPFSLNMGVSYQLNSIPKFRQLFSHSENVVGISEKKRGAFGGVGLAMAVPVGNSRYIEEDRPYLPGKPPSGPYIDFLYGYYFSSINLAFQISHASFNHNYSSYDYSINLHRRMTRFELISFLGGTRAFTPFFGAGYNLEQHEYEEKDGGDIVIERQSKDGGLLVTCGFEFRPDRRNNWLALRSSVRYLPWFMYEPDPLAWEPKELRLDQLQVTFLQFVYYPERHYAKIKEKRRLKDLN